MKKPIDLEKAKESYLDFVASRKNLILGLLDDQGRPFISYAPFVKKDGRLYIYISKIADHYHYLEKSEYADVLLIADEAGTNNKFATERVRWLCTSKYLGNEGFEEVFDLFNKEHGAKMIELLRSLDFSLFELTPSQGRYVVGFGMAFDVDLDAQVFNHVVVDKSNTAEQGS